MKKTRNNDVAAMLTTKPKTVVLAKKKRKTAISVDAQEGGGSKRMPIPKGVYALEAKSHTVCGLLQEKDNQCVAFPHNEGLLRESGDKASHVAYKYQTFAELLYACYSRLRFRFGTLNEKRAVYVMSTLSDQKSLRFQNGTARSSNVEGCNWKLGNYLGADAIEAATWYDSLTAA